MTAIRRILAEAGAEWRSFVRRRTAVFFTFFFPIILIVVFGALVQTDSTGGGLFAEPAGYYVAGYLAVVVLFTPLSRVSSSVARNRAANRFEKLATTPLTRLEWLLAHVAVNAAVVLAACLLLLALLAGLTAAPVIAHPAVIPFVVVGVAAFSGIGALLGRLADSQDGAVAAANAVGLPMLFLAETFIPPELLPNWLVPAIGWLPLTPFTRGVRAATYEGGPWLSEFAILLAAAILLVAVGAWAIPRTE